MIQIRYNIYETNSSSVHALVIPNDNPIVIPKTVRLRGGEYGWEDAEYWDTLNYLYEACRYHPTEKQKLLNFLNRLDIEIEEDTKNVEWNYVDHCNCIPFEELFGDENLLTKFLFGVNSYVKTGNDNNDDIIYPEETPDVTILWKDN